jgi:antitoxin VapB
VVRGSERLATRLSEFEDLVLAGQNMLHHKPPEILMDMQIKHLVSGSSFAMSILMSLAPQIDWILGFTFISSRIKMYVYIHKRFAMANTKLFKNGNSQAVRIPAELAYSSWDVDLVIERQGDELRIRPAQRRMGDVLGKLAKFSPDFMAQGRGDNREGERETL